MKICRDCVSPNLEDEDKEVGSHRSKCLPRPFRVTAVKPSSRNEALLSPASDVPKNTFAASICNQSRYLGSSHGGSNRISDSSSARGSSIRLESLREEKGKVIKIEERQVLPYNFLICHFLIYFKYWLVIYQECVNLFLQAYLRSASYNPI